MTHSVPAGRHYPKWNKSISVGDVAIDKDHQEILDHIALVAGVIEGDDRPGLLAGLDRIIVQVERHFRSEEKFFAETDYPFMMAHRIEHRVLAHMARHVRAAAEMRQDPSFISLSLRYFAQALVEHVIESDMGYRPYLAGRNAAG